MVEHPHVQNIQVTSVRFPPGTKLLVRTFFPLDDEARRRITRTIHKWAGSDVEVLVYCGLQMEVSIENGRQDSKLQLP